MSHEGVDYGVAASSAGNQMKLVQAIVDDVELQNDIFIINPQKDSMSYICEKMAAMSFDKDAKIPITLKNVTRVFEAFSTKICADKKYSSNEMVGLFIDAIRYPEKRIIGGDYLVVPPYKPMKVNMMKTIGLFKFFDKPSDAEAKELTQIYDTLVKDDERRMHGFFSTPQIWSDLGHKYVADYFKKIGFIEDGNWEGSDKIVCWDPAAGTKSLTKAYRFKNLYVSTLEQSELNASVDLSPEAKETFVFDFLNDPTSKLPESLKNELQNLRHTDKKLVVLMNPPYGQAVDRKYAKNKKVKTNISKSVIADYMIDLNMGLASRELFTQFLFRINHLIEEFKLSTNQVVIGTFSNPTFMCGSSFKNFRKFWLPKWKYDAGFLFNASEFKGCSAAWAVSFSVWSNIKSSYSTFMHDVYENDDGLANKISEHELYNADVVKSFDSIVPFKAISPELGMTFSSGDLGHNNYTNITINDKGVVTSAGGICHICSDNIDLAIQLYALRNVISPTWYTGKDIYKAPDTSNPLYAEWVKDCYVKSIDSYVDSKDNHVNNFFPFRKAETYKLLGQELMKNEADEKRWCLANGKFDSPSPEGKAVLDAFAACIKASAPFRREFEQSHPELQLDHWDAGYRQMRELFKTACPEELKVFKAALKALKAKMAPMVYKLGFLQK